MGPVPCKIQHRLPGSATWSANGTACVSRTSVVDYFLLKSKPELKDKIPDCTVFGTNTSLITLIALTADSDLSQGKIL